MANLQFSSDLIDEILFRAGEPTDGTSEYEAAALRHLNRFYQILWMGGGEFDPEIHEEWWWLRKDPPGVLKLEPVIEAGTVNLTNNSTSATFSSAPASSVKDWFLKADLHADILRISAHTAGAAAATLDAVYTGETDTASKYKLMKLEYSLASDLIKVVSPMRAYQDSRSEVDGVSLPSLERRYPLRLIQSGVPRYFAHVAEQKVRFSHYGGTSATKLIRLEYDYLQRPAVLTDSGTEEPLIPWAYRRLLADGGLFFLLQDKNDGKAEGVGLEVKRAIKAMARENRTRLSMFSRRFGAILARPEKLPEQLEPLRTESGLIIG